MEQVFFVFDVESIGLHGEGYAVAGGVYFADGTVDKSSEFIVACQPEQANGESGDRQWVHDNVPVLEETNCENPREVRERFWKFWETAKREYPGIVMAGECVWPVEAGFLSACIKDNPEQRRWNGPYPLHEIASFMLAAGMDPMATYDRLDSELPKHHPLADARQSARLLCEAIELIEESN
jgi:hypothetical protein